MSLFLDQSNRPADAQWSRRRYPSHRYRELAVRQGRANRPPCAIITVRRGGHWCARGGGGRARAPSQRRHGGIVGDYSSSRGFGRRRLGERLARTRIPVRSQNSEVSTTVSVGVRRAGLMQRLRTSTAFSQSWGARSVLCSPLNPAKSASLVCLTTMGMFVFFFLNFCQMLQ
jgi:hypothetical protein